VTQALPVFAFYSPYTVSGDSEHGPFPFKVRNRP
jgi:hypothetical protein